MESSSFEFRLAVFFHPSTRMGVADSTTTSEKGILEAFLPRGPHLAKLLVVHTVVHTESGIIVFHPPTRMRIADSMATPIEIFPQRLFSGDTHLLELLGMNHGLVSHTLIAHLGQRQLVLWFCPSRLKDWVQQVHEFLPGCGCHEESSKGKGSQYSEHPGVGVQFRPLEEAKLFCILGTRIHDNTGTESQAFFKFKRNPNIPNEEL